MTQATAAQAPRLIALDWGTSSLRGYLLGDHGQVLEARAAPWGVMQLADRDFAGAFQQLVGPWLSRAPNLPAIAAGMIGGTQGWRDVPYRFAPTGIADLAEGLGVIDGGAGARLHVVPGVADFGAAPNVMRGEETEVMGVLGLRPDLGGGCRIVSPGTHSKWTRVEGSKIGAFTTYMTGEVFGVMSAHSILGAPALAAVAALPQSPHWPAFERGVAAVRASPAGLWPLMFSARALILARRLAAAHSLDYLSGLLIGEELRCAELAGDLDGAVPLVVVGAAGLTARYLRALAVIDGPPADVIEAPAIAGLWRIAGQAGLIEPSPFHQTVQDGVGR